MWFANISISFHSLCCLFCLMYRSFSVWFHPFVYFCFQLSVFWESYPKNHCTDQCQENFSLCFCLVVLYFMLLYLSLIHFELYFIYIGWDKGPVSFLCIWISSFPNIIYWRNYPFPIICSWHPGQISFCHRCGALFLGSILFHWYVYMSDFTPVPYYFDDVALKFKNMMPPALFFFSIALVIWCLYEFHKNFRMTFCFYKEYHWGLGKNCIDSMDNFVVLRF